MYLILVKPPHACMHALVSSSKSIGSTTLGVTALYTWTTPGDSPWRAAGKVKLVGLAGDIGDAKANAGGRQLGAHIGRRGRAATRAGRLAVHAAAPGRPRIASAGALVCHLQPLPNAGNPSVRSMFA